MAEDVLSLLTFEGQMEWWLQAIASRYVMTETSTQLENLLQLCIHLMHGFPRDTTIVIVMNRYACLALLPPRGISEAGHDRLV